MNLEPNTFAKEIVRDLCGPDSSYYKMLTSDPETEVAKQFDSCGKQLTDEDRKRRAYAEYAALKYNLPLPTITAILHEYEYFELPTSG